MTVLLVPDRAPALHLVPPARATEAIVRNDRASYVAARERLLDEAFGPQGFAEDIAAQLSAVA
jgi:hypothetical protein